MNKFRQILDHSLNLASAGELDEALTRLNRGIEVAMQENDRTWLVLLAKNAGILFERKGDLNRAKVAYGEAVKFSEPDPYLHYSLGDICLRLGQPLEAGRHFDTCRRLARERNDQELLKMLDTRFLSNKETEK